MEKEITQQLSTRRKSCVACVKAKRRCDLQVPCCTRCCTRGLICNYLRVNPTPTGGPESSQLPLPPLFLNPAFNPPPYIYSDLLAPNYIFDDLLSPSLVPPGDVYLSRDKLDACVKLFRSYIISFVQNGRTPFISPHLYNDELPRSLQDAYLLCAAYVSKTSSNEALVFGMLSSKVNKLLAEHQSCSIEDELASVQALIMYQIIRLFDGDIRQRGTAEAQFLILDIWATHLRRQGEFRLPISIMSSPYLKWLFIESLRRTALMSLFLQGIYHAIKDGFCDKVPDMAGLPVTVRGDLWEVETEGEWMLATSGRQPDVMTYHEFVDVWDGCPAGCEVEGFQKVLLIACIGVVGLQTRFFDSLSKSMGWG